MDFEQPKLLNGLSNSISLFWIWFCNKLPLKFMHLQRLKRSMLARFALLQAKQAVNPSEGKDGFPLLPTSSMLLRSTLDLSNLHNLLILRNNLLIFKLLLVMMLLSERHKQLSSILCSTSQSKIDAATGCKLMQI